MTEPALTHPPAQRPALFVRAVLFGFYPFVALLFLLSVAGLCHQPRHFELASHFRLQYLWAAALCGVLLTLRRVWTWAALAWALVVFNALFIAPLYQHPRPPTPGRTGVPLKVMLSNVMGGNRRYDLLLAAVRAERPDVLVIQECTPRWWDNLSALKAEYPYTHAELQYGGGGIGLFSRYPLTDTQTRRIDSSTHPLVTTNIQLKDVSVTFVTIHPRTPLSNAAFALRNGQLAWVADYVRAAAGPKVVLGDFNTSLFSPYFRDLLRNSGLFNARQGWGILPSWPYRYLFARQVPPFLRIPIDHCLVSEDLKVAGIRLGPGVGSDHLPLIADLVIEP